MFATEDRCNMYSETTLLMAILIIRSHVHHVLVQLMLSVTLYDTIFVGCACLEDVLSFLNNASPCRFDKEYFISKFIDDQKECLSNCSVSSSDPLNITRTYDLEYMEIQFSETPYRFYRSMDCNMFPYYPKVSLKFLCEGRHFYERGIGERCINSSQCRAVNPGSTCNLSSGKCGCQEGYLGNSTTCIEARGLGSDCTESKECQEMNAKSTCNIVSSKCKCQQGFIQHFNSCLPARKLGEPCDDPLQCSVISQNSTCNDTSNVCECEEGYLEVLNTCTKGRLFLDEMCESNRQSAILDQKTDMQNICSTLSAQIYNPSKESSGKDQTVINVGVGLAGILFGILGCLAVMFIRNRRLMEAQNKYDENNSGNMYEETLVQEAQVRKVYEELNSTNTLGREKLNDPEDHGTYNQVNENAIKLHVLSDDGYCLPHGASADVDSHVASGYDKSKDCPGDYVEVN